MKIQVQPPSPPKRAFQMIWKELDKIGADPGAVVTILGGVVLGKEIPTPDTTTFLMSYTQI